jgi:hypothetical protein
LRERKREREERRQGAVAISEREREEQRRERRPKRANRGSLTQSAIDNDQGTDNPAALGEPSGARECPHVQRKAHESRRRAGKKMHHRIVDQMAHNKNTDVAQVSARSGRRF